MNIYVVVEGETETVVYPSWIPLVNPELTHVDHPSMVVCNNFCIVSARGYPFNPEVIDAAIDDVNSIPGFDRLVIFADSEEATRDGSNALNLASFHQIISTHGE